MQGSANSTSDQIAAFDEPNSVRFNKSSFAAYQIAPSTSTISYNLKANCFCKTSNNNKVKVVLPIGLTYSSSVGGTSNADSIVFKNINFTKAFQTDSVALTITATASGCALDSVINDNRDNKTIGGFTNTTITGTNSWKTTNLFSNSPTRSWQASDTDVQTEMSLTSNAFTPTKLSLLSFWHLYDFEGGFDGGIVEYSINNGTNWQSLEGNFLQNGHNTLMSSAGAIPNSNVFSGTTNNQFVNSIANLSKLFGNSVKLRFRMATDVGNSGSGTLDGWVLDDIAVINGCGNFVKFYLYDSTNNLLDSASIPVFITPKILPVKYASFTAKALGKTSLLQWNIVEQINVKNYVIERSFNANNWEAIGDITAQNSTSFEYLFYDKKPFEGLNYYRIKAVDFNGAINYSTIKTVNFKETKNQILIVPNPAKSFINIYVAQSFNASQVNIYDVQGKLILTQAAKTINTGSININTSTLTQGAYLLSISNKEGNVLTEKLMINK